MTSSAHIYDRFGALELPLEQLDTNSLTDLDPARDNLLALFKAAVNAELGERWAKAIDGVGKDHCLYASVPVADSMGLEATLAHIQQRKSKFPLLCLHRAGKAENEEHTLYSQRLKQPWHLSYILGPLDVADIRRFGDACIFVAKLVQRVIERRGHPAYQGGATQFVGEGSPSDIGAIRKVSHEGPGQAQFADSTDGTVYYAITVVLETLEYAAEREDGESVPLEGASYDVGIGGTPEGVIRGLVYADTSVPLQPQ